MKDGQIGVRVALELGPGDTVEEGDWTDLTDRVRSYSDTRGRSDVLDEFPPGTATVVLDNGDRMLDPSNPDGYLFNGADPIGLPLCPVQVRQWWDGAWYPKFTGYLGPEAWPGDVSPKGNTGQTELQVMDALGHSPGLPGDMFGVMVAALQPDWWSRMDDFGFPILDDESHVPDSLSDGYGSLEGTTGICRPFTGPGVPETGAFQPGLLLSGDYRVRFPASGIMPDGDQDKWTSVMWWWPRSPLDGGEQAWVWRLVHPITGLHRWSVYVDGDDGYAYVTTFDAAETEVDTAVIEPLVTARWDSGQPHLVIAVYDAGSENNLTVWFGGVSATLNIPGDLYESDLLVGGAPVDVLVDELAIWQRALSYENEIAPIFLAGGLGVYWGGDTWHDRLGHWIETTGRTVTSDDTEEMHFPVEDVEALLPLLHPKRATAEDPSDYYSVTLPDTLADAYQVTVANGGGARWATKGGFLRARTIHTLEDPTFADHYATPVLFTDADATLGAGEFRHAGVRVTGLRIDRVINDAKVTYLYIPGGAPFSTPEVYMTSTARDPASQRRYGKRTWDTETDWCDWPLNQQLADLHVSRFAQPHQEIENIHLDPTGTGGDAAALAEWLITECELEKACSVTYTSEGADPVTVEGLNIQQIRTEWTPERWSVDLVAAKS